MDVLLETHDEKEVQMALLSGADIIGINNRNLNTFEVSIDTTIKLLELIPKDKIVVSESGFDNENDIKKIKNTRVNAILVGESFMRTDDILGKAKLFRKSFVGD